MTPDTVPKVPPMPTKPAELLGDKPDDKPDDKPGDKPVDKPSVQDVIRAGGPAEINDRLVGQPSNGTRLHNSSNDTIPLLEKPNLPAEGESQIMKAIGNRAAKVAT